MSATTAETFRVSVRKSMDDKGVTIQKLADTIGTSRPSMSRILSGGENVSLERAVRIADALETCVSELLGEIILEHA